MHSREYLFNTFASDANILIWWLINLFPNIATLINVLLNYSKRSFGTRFDLIGQSIVGHDIKTEFTHRRVCTANCTSTFVQRKYDVRTGRNSTFENYSWLARIVYLNCLRSGLVPVECLCVNTLPSFFVINHIESRKHICANIV